MSRKLISLIACVAFVVCGNSLYALDDSAGDKALELRIDTDKNVVGLGDDIIINYHLTNIGKEEIRIVPWYQHRWIRIYDKDGNEVKSVALIFYDLKIFPDRDDYVLLRPKESFDAVFKGRIRNDKLALGGSIPENEGYWIDFKDRAIVLDRTDTLVIRGIYKGDLSWKEEGEKRFGFQNIWVGEIKSNIIRIGVSKNK